MLALGAVVAAAELGLVDAPLPVHAPTMAAASTRPPTARVHLLLLT
jgi:hypothetical protein